MACQYISHKLQKKAFTSLSSILLPIRQQTTLQSAFVPTYSLEKSESEIPPMVQNVLQSSGQPLDAAIRTSLEPRFGHDFSQVRVHTDERAAESARAVNALAYTVGQHIVFGDGHYNPAGPAGRSLLAHELTHVVQQAQTGQPTLQRQPAGSEEPKKEEKETDVGEVLVEGLKTVGEQAKDNNPKVKEEIIEPVKKYAQEKIWGRLSTGERVLTLGHGAMMGGLTLGPLLADPEGRKMLEDINLCAPFSLIPYMPLIGCKYQLPSAATGPERLFRFETNFAGDDYLKLLQEKIPNRPEMSLSVNMQWGYDPASEKLSVLGAQGQLGLFPGLSISAGAYKGLLPTPEVAITPEGRMVETKKRLPELPSPAPVPDVRFMINVDLLKLNPPFLKRQIRQFQRTF